MASTSTAEGFAERLREARLRAGLTQRELGEQAQVNYSQISRYEQGLAMPRPGVLLRLADVLGVPLEHLRDDANIAIYQLYAHDEAEPFVRLSVSAEEHEQLQSLADQGGVTLNEILMATLLSGLENMKSKSGKDKGKK